MGSPRQFNLILAYPLIGVEKVRKLSDYRCSGCKWFCRYEEDSIFILSNTGFMNNAEVWATFCLLHHDNSIINGKQSSIWTIIICFSRDTGVEGFGLIEVGVPWCCYGLFEYAWFYKRTCPKTFLKCEGGTVLVKLFINPLIFLV